MSITLFVLLCAIVVDISFYWVNTLRAQRAADAAALAGAVYLPGDITTAYSEARASATQNGFTNGGGVTVTPVQDSSDPRQLDVTISASVPTFFARVIGITSWPMARTAKGVYVLPVPMGSPLDYYGVGDYSVNKTSAGTVQTGLTGNSGATSASATPSDVWTSSRGTLVAAVSGTGSGYAYSTTNGQSQQWSSFGLLSNLAGTDAITSVNGIQVTLTNVRLSASCSSSSISVALSGDGGANWTSGTQVTGALTTSNQPFTFGATNSMAAWPGQTWNEAALSDGRFRLRLMANKGCSTSTTRLRVDAISVQANYTYSRTTPGATTTVTTAGVSDGATFLNSQGAWGAIITKGGQQGNGDAYAPANDGSNANLNYDPSGYMYALQMPSGGSVKVFDPGFCAMGSNGTGGSLGAGDHWIGTSGTPVSTYYTLWNTNGKLGLQSTWSKVYTSNALFEDETGYDPSNMGPNGTGSAPGGATAGCDPYHNAWWTLPTGLLPGGTYVLQVQTSKTNPPSSSADSSVNAGTNAENMWAIEAAGAGAQVYGNGRMTVYNNLAYNTTNNGIQQFYLAKIDQATGAGKTALIDLFDAGDINGNGTLTVLSPDGGTPQAVNFNYTTDSNCQAQTGTSPCGTYTNVSQFITTYNSKQATNNTWIHISIPLPNTYGSTGLWKGGWWQIQYTVTAGGNDTTTWQVSVQGNPVHLVVP